MEELTFFRNGYFTDFFESGYQKLVCYHKNVTYEFHILRIWKTKHHVNTVGKSKATITHTALTRFYQSNYNGFENFDGVFTAQRIA